MRPTLLLAGALLAAVVPGARASGSASEDLGAPARTGSGRLLVLDDGGGPPRYVLERRAGIEPVAEQPGLEAVVGRRVALRDGTVVSSEPAPAPRTTGTLRTLLVRVAYADVAARPYGAEQAAGVMGGSPASVDGFYDEQSAGGTRIAADVVPEWVQSSKALPPGECFDTSFTADAIAGAREQGFDPDAYDRVVFVRNANPCPGTFAGFAPIGGRFVVADSLTERVVVHELGHTLGAQHASSASCTDDAGTPVTLHAPGAGSCATMEYGDPFDAMGDRYPTRLMSLWHRAQLGELRGQARTPLQSGTFTIDAAPGDGSTLVTIPRSADPTRPVVQWFALELRAPTRAFDTFTATDPVASGVSLRIAYDLATAGKPILLDTHPATATLADAALQPGETFTDPYTEITIHVDAIANGHATVTTTQPTRLDTAAPTAPGAPTLTRAPGGIRADWARADDDITDVPAYEVTCDGVPVGTTARTTALIADGPAGSVHACSVVAVDSAQNRSPAATATLDDQPPAAPVDVRVARTGAAARVSWGAAEDDRGVAGYEVSRTDLRRQVAATAFTDPATPGDGTTYAVVALDAAGNRSAPATTTLAPAEQPSGIAVAPGDPGSAASPAPPGPPPRAQSGVARAPRLTIRLLTPRLAHGRRRLGRTRTLRFAVGGAIAPLRATVTVGRRTVGLRALRLSRAEARRGTVVVRVVDAAGRTAVLRLGLRADLVRILG